MISQCCICKKIEGVKCPKCGTEVPDSAMLDITPIEKFEQSPRWCMHCGHQFKAKDGGYSHGYCKPCLDGELAKVKGKKDHGVSQVLANYNHGVSLIEE